MYIPTVVPPFCGVLSTYTPSPQAAPATLKTPRRIRDAKL
ncbi:hypothetical protein EMIT0P43_10264 [Pseudomonas jessenii]